MPRFFDLLILLILAPAILLLFMACIVMVFFGLGFPIFFSQPRGGFRGEVFDIRKFRTMTDERDSSGKLLPDSQRINRVGRFLRSTSLDELPSLINVIRGEMRLVGPRPFMSQYLPLYSPQQARRHDVRPGITGWAQVNGRNALSWEEKFDLDVWYVENRSFWLDIRILWMTLLKVVRRDGINSDSDNTMPLFTGSAR